MLGECRSMNREKFYTLLSVCATSLVLLYALWPSAMVEFSYSKHDQGFSSLNVPDIPLFEERSLELGVHAIHRESYEFLSGLDQTLGGGACVIDFNNDGWLDLLVVAGSGQVQNYGKSAWWSRSQSLYLFRNNKGLEFVDVTKQVGLGNIKKGMGCAVGDLNNNGLADIVVTSIGQNYLFENKGDGVFSDVTASSGFSGVFWSTSVAIADFDRDGLQDIYITNYVDYEKGGRRFEQNAGFEAIVSGDFNPALFDPVPNQLYRNTGEMTFSDESSMAGVSDSSGRGLSAQWADINGDDWPDLLVINHSASPNRLFVNDQNGGFDDLSGLFGVSSVSAGQASTVADINHDGKSDFFISAASGYAPALAIRQPGSNKFTDGLWHFGLGNHSSINSSGWGVVVQDFNNDGLLDVFVNNGLTTPDRDSPSLPQGQPNDLWLGQTSGLFRRDSALGKASGRGLVSIDYDNDGDLDLIIVNNNDPVELWVNQGNSNHWFGVIVEPGQGAVVEPVAIEVRTTDNIQRKVSGAQGSFLSQSDPRTHFGLGNNDEIEELVLRWQDGTRRSFRKIEVDRYVVVNKSGQLDTLNISEASPPEQYQFDALEPEFLPRYGKWLASVFESPTQRKELLALYRSSGQQVRIAILAGLGQGTTPEVLPFLQLALESSDEKEVLAGLELAELIESESSVRWLMPLLSGAVSEDIKCRVAAVFEHFFREEEAAVHRKFKAVSPLVRLLESGESDRTIVCALGALAESEHYRALEPTAGLTRSDKPSVRLEAVKTLGRLRERAAISPLNEMLSTQRLAPSTLAVVLVALSRLGVDPLSQGMLSAADWRDSPERQRNFLKTVLELRSSGAAGIAFDYRRLQGELREFLEMTPLPADVTTVELATETILEFRNREADKQLEALIASYEELAPQILSFAFGSKLLTDSSRFIGRLMAMPVATRNSVLGKAGVLGLDVLFQGPPPSNPADNATLEFVIRALDFRHSGPFIQNALQTAMSTEIKNDSLQRLALRQCRRLRAQNLKVSEPLLRAQDSEMRVLAFRCLEIQQGSASKGNLFAMIRSIARAPDSTSVEFAEAARAISELRPRDARFLSVELIQSADTRPELLRQVILALASRQSPAAPVIIRELTGHDDASVRTAAIEFGYSALPSALKSRLSMQVMTNPNEQLGIRMLAAEYLLRDDPEAVLAAMMLTQRQE